MVESLRRWGGAFAAAPVYAVSARYDAPLSPATHENFKRFDVRYVNLPSKTPYSWFKYYNKPVALAAVEAAADTETIAWLDSDILIVDQPEAFLLEQGIDFAACPSVKEMGTCGPGDPFEPIWRANCRSLGIDIEALPWVVSKPDNHRMRVYWNSGVFVYRRSTEFGREFLKTCTRLMDAKNSTTAKGFSISINEMGAVGLAMHTLGLKWRELPTSHNYHINWRTHAQMYYEQDLRAAKIIHYHDSMFPFFWKTFIECLQSTHPQVAEWLLIFGPLRNEAPYFNRLMSKTLRTLRNSKERAYIKSCHNISADNKTDTLESVPSSGAT